MFSRMTRPRSLSAVALLVLLSTLLAPSSAQASSLSPALSASTDDVDVVGIIVSVFSFLGEVVQLVLAIVNAVI
jgi:hypothetical protein